MDAYTGVGYELLIEIGNWSLQRSFMTADNRVGICHSKCPHSWMCKYAKDNGECIACNEKIPQDVLGLWVLYNFDKYADI